MLGDRQESLEPGAEVYLGLLTGRFVEKLAKVFSPTLNDIRLPCKQGSNRIWDRSHEIERNAFCAEVYLGLLTGRFVEKLAKDFSPTLNDIRLPCKQGSSRIWDRSHEIERGAIYTVFEPSKNLLELCSSEYCCSSEALCCHHVSFICLSSV